ncbi:MAG TPA: hypothetical protein VD969_19980 [Symbiobacteriaceae bacterium]|nr:hypothetical protein [Symbiobacteriaceae bacterium]
MLELYVAGAIVVRQLGRKLLDDQRGLTAIEYGVFAAFLVLALVGVAVFAGPQLKTWMMGTMCGIMNKNYTPGATACS